MRGLAARFLTVFAVAFALIGGTAFAAPAKFYDANLNGFATCPPGGVAGTAGGSFGSARVKSGDPDNTVSINVRGLVPDTYFVTFTIDSCAVLITSPDRLTTNSRGSGSGSFTFSTTSPSGFFQLRGRDFGGVYATQPTPF